MKPMSLGCACSAACWKDRSRASPLAIAVDESDAAWPAWSWQWPSGSGDPENVRCRGRTGESDRGAEHASRLPTVEDAAARSPTFRPLS